LYVTLLEADAIAKVDVETRRVVLQRPVGQAPGQLVIHDHKAYVGITALDDQYVYGQGKLTVYDCRTDAVITSFNVGTNPNSLAVDADGRLHVCCAGDYWSDFCHMYLIDTESDVILDSLYLGGSPSSLSIGPGNIAYLAAGGWATTGQMYAYDARTLEVFHSSANPRAAVKGCIAVNTFQDERIFAVGFYDTLQAMAPNGASLARYAVGDGPVHVAFNYVPGDLDGDWVVSMGDLTILIDMLFISFQQPEFLLWRANVDGDFNITMGDLTMLISDLFIAPGVAPLRVGPTWID
jgi:DNA-binding beta-propeller fold protein YncE